MAVVTRASEPSLQADGGGATPGGWMDETFYLIKPGNFAQPKA